MECQLPTVTFMYSFHIFTKENIGTEMVSKWKRNKRAFFTHPVSLNHGQLFDLKSGLHFCALPDIPV